MGHTKGPWELLRQGKEIQGDGGHEVWCFVNSIGISITEIPVESYNEDGNKAYHVSKVESLANARLIAAAPDLLAALQRFIDFANKQIEESSDKYKSSMVRQGEAAIAKAEPK
jgi:hypothetical protein